MMVTIEEIQVAVADFFGLSLEEVTLHSRKRIIALPRPIAMFLARQFTGASLHEIAQHFSCNSYKIVRSSIARIDEQRRTDVALNRVLEELSEALKNRRGALRIVDAHNGSRKPDHQDDGWYTRVVGSSHGTQKPMAQ